MFRGVKKNFTCPPIISQHLRPLYDCHPACIATRIANVAAFGPVAMGCFVLEMVTIHLRILAIICRTCSGISVFLIGSLGAFGSGGL